MDSLLLCFASMHLNTFDLLFDLRSCTGRFEESFLQLAVRICAENVQFPKALGNLHKTSVILGAPCFGIRWLIQFYLSQLLISQVLVHH